MESLLSAENALLFEAASSDGPRALDALDRWRTDFDIDATDSTGFQLLPWVYERHKAQLLGTPVSDRLRGISKYVWSLNQTRRRALERVFDAVSAAIDPRSAQVIWPSDGVAGELLARFPQYSIALAVAPDSFLRADAALAQAGWGSRRRAVTPLLAMYLDCVVYSSREHGRLELWFHPLGVENSRYFRSRALNREVTSAVVGRAAFAPSATELLWLSLTTRFDFDPSNEGRRLLIAGRLLAEASDSIDWTLISELTSSPERRYALRQRAAWLNAHGFPEAHGKLAGGLRRGRRVAAQSMHRASRLNALRSVIGRYRAVHREPMIRPGPAGPLSFARYTVDYARYRSRQWTE